MINNERKSNFELLRVISILMVLGLHYNLETMGGAFKYLIEGEVNYYFSLFIETACIVSVNCFILITGYFMCNRERINIRKVIDLITLVGFYNIGIYIVTILIGGYKFNIIDFITQLLQPKWFIIVYIALYLLLPYINKVINNISRKEFNILIIISKVLFSIWPSFAFNINNTPTNDRGYGIIHFILIYLIGAYIRKYDILNKQKYQYFFRYILLIVITFLISTFSRRVWDYNFIINIISSIMLFGMFKNIKIESKIINYISPFTLSVFIIHTDNIFIKYIWVNTIDVLKWCNGNWYIIHLLLSIIGVYIVCILIDIVRTFIFNKTIYKLYNRIKIFNIEIQVK